jgi:hypothetical protein
MKLQFNQTIVPPELEEMGSGEEIIGARAFVEWADTNEKEEIYISLMDYDEGSNCDTAGIPDDHIAFYADSLEHLKNMKYRGHAPFKIIDYKLVTMEGK